MFIKHLRMDVFQFPDPLNVPKCVTAWKFFGLDKANKERKFVSNECFVCKSGLCNFYKDLYDHDWNSNGTVTRYNINARNVTDDVTNYDARIQVRAPTTTLNFRDQQQSKLSYYEERNVDYRNNQLYFNNSCYKTISNHPLNLLN